MVSSAIFIPTVRRAWGGGRTHETGAVLSVPIDANFVVWFLERLERTRPILATLFDFLSVRIDLRRS